MILRKVVLSLLTGAVLYSFTLSGSSASAQTFSVSEVESSEAGQDSQITDAQEEVSGDSQSASVTEAPVVLAEPEKEPEAAATSAPKAVSTKAPVVSKATKKPKTAVTSDNSKSKKEKKVKKSKKNTEQKVSYSKADLRLMSSIINCEAGGECYQGKLAVGIVVMNRIKSSLFPNSLKGVIYQRYQFTPVRNGSLRTKLTQYDKGQTNSAQWKACISAAKKTLSGQNTIVMKGKMKSMKGVHFFSVGLSHPKFKLGGHRFK